MSHAGEGVAGSFGVGFGGPAGGGEPGGQGQGHGGSQDPPFPTASLTLVLALLLQLLPLRLGQPGSSDLEGPHASRQSPSPRQERSGPGCGDPGAGAPGCGGTEPSE